MKQLMVWICWLYALPVCGQGLAGNWTGVLAHRSCFGATRSLGALLQLTPHSAGGSSQWKGSLRYYTDGIVSAADSLATPPLWEFAVRARLANGQLIVSYSAGDEQSRGIGLPGYYLMGQYTLVMTPSGNGSAQRLNGFYGGSNGGRGEIYFTRGQSMVPTDSLGATFARLRNRLAGSQKLPALSSSDTAQAFAALTADTTLQATQRKKTTRGYDTVQTLAVGAAAYIDVSMYDNAVEDGDTVSLFANEQLVAHRIGLAGRPRVIRLFKPADHGTTLLTMVAENLGSIPPNTAWMVIESAQGVRHTLRLASSDTQSGSLLIRWQ
jgi:hypothetical protein